jgi:hypothetical protein
MKRTNTFIVLSTLSLIAAAWECWTILNNQPGDTFSATLRQLGKSQPFIILMFGMVSGHLWWPMNDKQPKEGA